MATVQDKFYVYAYCDPRERYDKSLTMGEIKKIVGKELVRRNSE